MLFGHVVPAAALEWLVNPPERSAAPDALKQLAVISALRKCKATESKWGVPAEVLESQWGLSPPSLGAELLALQAAGRCLPPPLALALALALPLALALTRRRAPRQHLPGLLPAKQYGRGRLHRLGVGLGVGVGVGVG